jgi:hypothetical protein
VFKRAAHRSLSWASLIQPVTPNNLPLRSILIWYSHLLQGLLNCLFPQGFPTKILYIFNFSPMRAICPDHFIHFYFIVLIILSEKFKSWISSLRSFT